jgi:AraC-like DNA-binding protein
VIRRYRLLEAAESVREGNRVSWAGVAADLGYADQAHLTRDFRAAIGQTPVAYADAQPPADHRLGRGGNPVLHLYVTGYVQEVID